MSLTAKISLGSARGNIFHELEVHHVWKVGINRFWAHEAKMSLTVNSSLESARGIFLMNSRYIMSRKYESNVFRCGGRNDSNQPSAPSNRREENFSWTRRTSFQESRNQTFWCSGSRNESNSHQFARIGEKKNFSWTRRTSCLESMNQTFFGSGGRNGSNSHQIARIGVKKIFH